MKEQKATAQRKRTDASSLYRKQQEHRAKLRNFQVDTSVMVLPLVRQQRRPQAPGPKLHTKEDISFALLDAQESGGGGSKVGQVLRVAIRDAIS